MEFCVISPTCLLEEYSTRSRWQMCVAAWVVSNGVREDTMIRTKYWEFYKSRVAAGDKVILDNGAYEGQMVPNDIYIKMIEDLKPYAYVVPDLIRNHEGSLKLERTFPLFVGSRRIFVVHDHLGNLPSTCDWFAVPKWWGKERVARTTALRSKVNRPIHALGFIDDNSLDELLQLAALGVQSIDSSEPVWKGLWESSAPYKFKVAVHQQFMAKFKVNVNLEEVFRLCGARESTMLMQSSSQPPNPLAEWTKEQVDKIASGSGIGLGGIGATLRERGARYGRFSDQARITQGLKASMCITPNWSKLTDDKKEALEMIGRKIARILNGDPNYHDSWHDIEGYARLVADTLKEEK